MPQQDNKPLSRWAEWRKNTDSIDDLCSRIINGETLTAIARSMGAGVSTLTDWIAADPERSARAREARIAAAGSYEEQALDELRDAADPFALAKAKEVAHHLRWKASKANPRVYGDKLDLTGEVGIRAMSEESVRDEALALAAKLGIALDTTSR